MGNTPTPTDRRQQVLDKIQANIDVMEAEQKAIMSSAKKREAKIAKTSDVRIKANDQRLADQDWLRFKRLSEIIVLWRAMHGNLQDYQFQTSSIGSTDSLLMGFHDEERRGEASRKRVSRSIKQTGTPAMQSVLKQIEATKQEIATLVSEGKGTSSVGTFSEMEDMISEFITAGLPDAPGKMDRLAATIGSARATTPPDAHALQVPPPPPASTSTSP